MGPLQPITKRGNRYILTATCYSTKWAEALAVPEINGEAVAQFMFFHVISCFGCPAEWISDRGPEFMNECVCAFNELYWIRHRFATAYHPRTNGLDEKTNRVLVKILGKLAVDNADWDLFLDAALWAYRTKSKAFMCHAHRLI